MEVRRPNLTHYNGLFIFRGKNSQRNLLFNVHADVVPAGNIEVWGTHPFQPQENEGKLFGRGSADDKGGLASLLVDVSNR